MRQRNARVGGAPKAAVMPGTTEKSILRRRQRLQLFAAAPEDEGIAALQAHDAPALLRVLDQQSVDFFLRAADVAGGLAHADPRGIAPRQIEHRRRHQAIVQNHIGVLQRAQRLQGQEFRIAGAGAHQSHLAGGAGRGRGRRQQLLRDAPRALADRRR